MNTEPGQQGGVVVGLDLSNIFVGRQGAARCHREDPLAVRLAAREVRRLADDGRGLTKSIAIVNAVVPDPVARHFSRLFEVERVELGALTRREVGGDEILQNRLLYAMQIAHRPESCAADRRWRACWCGFSCFLPLIVSARRMGFGVEVFGWTESTNHRMIELANIVGTFIPLDDYYYAITFPEGGARFPQGVILGHRRREVAHPWSRQEADAVEDLVSRWRRGADPLGTPRAA